MREINFRGINNDGNWSFGDLIQSNNEHNVWIHSPKENHTYKVDPATVGQFTGLLDSAGKEIYEGDIIKFNNANVIAEAEEHLIVSYEVEHARFMIYNPTYKFPYWGSFGPHIAKNVTVIGNIYDNPELLEDGGDA